MLNKDSKRELAYLVKVDEILPMNADRLECARVGGWNCVVGKGEFKAGDYAVYFEIDSLIPDKPPFSAMEFLRSKNFKIKSQKIRGVVSEGLLMPLSAWIEEDGSRLLWIATLHRVIASGADVLNSEARFLTDVLGVTYASAEDNARKGSDIDKYKSMAARHSKLFKKPVFRWLMKYSFGRKLLFIFFGSKKKDSKKFPTQFPFVKQTNEERIENCPDLLKDKEPWVKTQKLDGTSSTYILAHKGRRKFEQYVCSRNVRQLTPSQKNYHTEIEGNVYWMMADKYHIFDFLKGYLLNHDLDYVCLQGEICGPSIQGNPHKFKELCFFGYNFIRSDVGRINSIEASKICELAGISWVPIVDTQYILPDDMETLKLDADGPCIVGSGPREGWVYRSQDGQRSFKNVSREYLLKH